MPDIPKLLLTKTWTSNSILRLQRFTKKASQYQVSLIYISYLISVYYIIFIIKKLTREIPITSWKFLRNVEGARLKFKRKRSKRKKDKKQLITKWPNLIWCKNRSECFNNRLRMFKKLKTPSMTYLVQDLSNMMQMEW